MNTYFAGVPISGNFGSDVGGASGSTRWLGTSDLLSLFMNTGILVAGIILVVLLVGGGMKIIQGAGNGDAKATAQGQQALTWALVGFLVVFFAYWGIRIVEMVLGVDFVTNPLNP